MRILHSSPDYGLSIRAGTCFFQRAVAVMISLLAAASLQAQPTKISDPNTKFNRVYVLGNGDNATEDAAFEDDLRELRNDLERSSNQASGSTSVTLIKPTRQQVEDRIAEERRTKQPGEELTLYLSGHGNVDTFRLNATNERMSAQQLAAALTGFRQSVTILVILDSCFGGSYNDDVRETDHVSVIGTSTTCPVDPPGIFGGFVETLTEDIADLGGEKEADTNGDGTVTADELKDALRRNGWKLGQPGAGDKVKDGKSKCLDCALPQITVTPPAATTGTPFQITGNRFEPGSTVTITSVNPNLQQVVLGQLPVSSTGTFSGAFSVSAVPSWILATDSTGNNDWHVLSLVCDADVDADIDLADINRIFSARNQAASPGDPRDTDGDRQITVNDARACTLRCTRPRCAV